MNRLFNIFFQKKALVLTDQVVFSGSSFLATFLTARLLSVSDFGLYAGFILVLYLMVSMSNALVIQPFQVLYSRTTDQVKYQNFVFWFQLGIVVVITIAIVCIALFISDVSKLYVVEAVIVGIGFLLHDFLRKLFLARDWVKNAFWIDCATGITQIILLGIALLSDKLNLSQALYFSGFSYMIGTSLGIYFLRPELKATRAWKLFFHDHVHQGKWLLLTAVIQWWSGNLFIVAAGVFLGPVALGAFRLVQSLFGILNVLLQTYENYVLPQAVRIYETSVTESKKYLQSISLKGALLFGTVLLLLFIFSEQVIYLAGGAKYVSYNYVIKGMAVLYFIIFVGYPVRMAVRMMLLNRIFFVGYAISFGVSLVSFNFLLKEYQLWGAIMGLIINQLILITFWQYFLAKKKFILWK
jgi:O-antigen/teichoic acid export membrane protein